jgi:hypothetical protein
MTTDGTPYESAYVSAFIYALGRLDGILSVGTDADSEEIIDPRGMAVLLTQNPLEAPYGDLAGGWNGRLFLLEFKRNSNEASSERRKDRHKLLLKALWNRANAQHKERADRGHFLVYPDSQSVERTKLIFQPYPSIVKPSPRTPTLDLNDFLYRLRWSGEKSPPGFTTAEFTDYLEFVKESGGVPSDPPPDRIAGLLVGVEPGGLVVLMQYGSLTELLERYREAVNNLRDQKPDSPKTEGIRNVT